MKISLKLSGLKRCLGIGAVLVMCLSTARATMQLTMMRPEFGPLYAARFHVHPEEIIKAKNGLNSQVGDMARSIHKITGYEVKFYKVEPNYQEIGSFPMFDTKQEWTKWTFGVKSHLEHVALAMGIPSPKDDIGGSQVAEFYKKGKVKEICEYCKRDVETTRAIYKRMIFQPLP